tara:strand:- start:145 stop:978 length:834 start_codon:yes stop_codon:yes gene_type:complete
MIGASINRPLIIVGKEGTKKKEQALSFFDDPIIKYANEFDIEDVFSIPLERGIIILEAHFKPKTELIVDTLLKYRGQIVLTSANQKDVPKKIFSLCKLKRAGKSKLQTEIKSLAPNCDEPEDYFKNVFEITHDYLKNKNRDEVCLKLKLNKPPDIQMLSWLVANLHPNKLAYLDAKVKRRWSQDYFYELLAYAHNGVIARGVTIPQRRGYDTDAKICTKLGLKRNEKYILEQLKQDPEFVKYMKTKLNHAQKRRAKIPDKVRLQKKKDSPVGLDNWM